MDDLRSLQESALIIGQTLQERREGDPLLNFEPTAKQRPFVDAILQGKTSEGWFVAANRSGKSDAGAYIGAHLARFGHPDPPDIYTGSGEGSIVVRDRATSGWVSGLDFPLLRDTLQPKYFDNGYIPPGATHQPFIPGRELVGEGKPGTDGWRVSDNTIKLKNGSIIAFKSADSGRAKYQGAEKDWVHLDEEHPEDIYDEIGIRVGARRMFMFCTATLLPPEGTNVGGVTWSYIKILKKFLQGKFKPEQLQAYTASIYDNPYIPTTEIARLEAKYDPSSIQGRIRLRGEWLPGLSGARAYTKFNVGIHVKPQKEFFNYRRPLCWAWDFNIEPMISLVGQRDNHIFRVMHEFYLQEADVFDMVQEFYNYFPKHGAELWLYGDATGKHRSVQSKSSEWQLILNALRKYAVPVRLKVPDKNPWIMDRIHAVQYALQNEDGVVSIQIDPQCENLILDLEQVLMDKNNKIRKVNKKSDVYYYRTHASDGFGYWVNYDAPVTSNTSEYRMAKRLKKPGYRFAR